MADAVNWRGGAGSYSFAYRFDETCAKGAPSFWVDEAQPGATLKALPFQSGPQSDEHHARRRLGHEQRVMWFAYVVCLARRDLMLLALTIEDGISLTKQVTCFEINKIYVCQHGDPITIVPVSIVDLRILFSCCASHALRFATAKVRADF
jgi:hypothetical protein